MEIDYAQMVLVRNKFYRSFQCICLGYACKGQGEGQCYRLNIETCIFQSKIIIFITWLMKIGDESDQAGPCSTDNDW